MKKFQQLSLFIFLLLTFPLLAGCRPTSPFLQMLYNYAGLPSDPAYASGQAMPASPTCMPFTSTPYIGADGKLWLDTTRIFDPAVEAPECYGIGQVSPSPSGQQFLVVMDCQGGQNQAFLFDADGTNKTKVTGQYDFMDYFQYEWSKDGKYLVYSRINSCCGGLAGAPPAGEVRYDLLSGEKVLLH